MAVAASPLLRNPASSTPEVTLENDKLPRIFNVQLDLAVRSHRRAS